MSEKPVAIVLGGTNPHIKLVNNLKARGYFVVLVDFLPNPPAKSVADIHIMESTLDKEKVLKVARICHASLVITTNIDQANVTACYVAEKMDLPRPYSYETALNVTEKHRMKKILAENGILSSAFFTVSSIEEVKNVIFPVVVKPVDSNGSRGVHRCDNSDELNQCLPIALNVSREKKAIVEGFVDGEEISFYYFIQNFKPYYITSNQRIKYKAKQNNVIQSAGGYYPAPQSRWVYERMESIATNIAKAFKLQNTPMFIQAIVQGEEVYVLEFAPRIGGGLSFRLIEQDNRFDIIDAAINSFLGEESQMNMIQPEYCSATMNVYAPGITVGGVTGVDQAINEGVAKEFHQYKLKGSEVSPDMSSGSRIGCFFIQGKNIDEIKYNIHRVNELVEVYDADGASSMRHDIYQNL